MKRYFYFLFALLLIFSYGCEKDEQVVEDPTTKDDENTELPDDEKDDVIRYEWNLPVSLPDNIEDLLIDAPCWEYLGSFYGEIINGKFVTEQSWKYMMLGTDFGIVVKFSEGKYVHYFRQQPESVSNTIYKNEGSWDSCDILEYKDGKLMIALGRSLAEGNGNLIQINVLTTGTKQLFDETEKLYNQQQK